MTTTADIAIPDVEPDVVGEKVGIYGLGLPEAAERRLDRTGQCHLVSSASEARIAVASTRLPRTRSVASVIEDLGDTNPELALLVLVHPGGEALAVEFLRAGAAAAVAEGNEARIIDWISGTQNVETLVESFERRLGRRGGDRTTGTIAGRSPFETRLHELGQGSRSRIGLVRLVGWEESTTRLSPEALELLRRRITVQLADLCRTCGVELEEIGPGEYGLVGVGLDAETADVLGTRLATVVNSFSPGRTSSLGFVMGHVGHEVSSDTATLLEIIRRTLDLADSTGTHQVVNADEMSHALASTTELDTAFRAVAFIERHDPIGDGHGARVAEMASAIAENLGVEGRELVRLRLAALLHDLGKVSLPGSAAYPLPDDTATDEYRSHPVLGAEALRAAGREVTMSVRHHHERWDGTGFPDGLSGEEIPLGSRLIAIADSVDRAQGLEGGLPAALAKLEEGAGAVFDPELVRLAVSLLSR